ncbi:MAG: NAD(P)H-quinone oxidoreductase [Actinobacteria bacterium]|nr:NAD(P)H-quinone oxidoreductase [Actinomycetota bacterium]
MWAMTCDGSGGTEVLQWREVPDVDPAADEITLDVVAAGVNRADLLQRQGLYPPPPGESEILGLECSGVVAAVGRDVAGWAVGDSACALLAGGGYAERVRVPVGQAMPIPAGVDLVSAAALPEVAATVYSNLELVAGLAAGDWLLIHGGGSGIGTFAIQYARAIGARVAVTAGSAEKLEVCRELGAEVLINYREQDFAAELREATEGHGADVILDIIGAAYLDANVRALAVGGRLVVIGLQGGVKGELNLGRLLSARGTISATSLRSRSRAEKSAICSGLVESVWPLIADGRIRPVIGTTYPLARAADAHEALAAGVHVGKLVLTRG